MQYKSSSSDFQYLLPDFSIVDKILERKGMNIKFKNGEEYHGDLKFTEDGGPIMEGSGRYKLKDGSIYIGSFVKNNKFGKCEANYKNGLKYSGDWKLNGPDGFGEMKYPDGSSYKGFWKDSKKNGYGETVFKNGSIYSGNFKDNEMNGNGKIENKDKTLIFKGLYEEGIPSFFEINIKDAKITMKTSENEENEEEMEFYYQSSEKEKKYKIDEKNLAFDNEIWKWGIKKFFASLGKQTYNGQPIEFSLENGERIKISPNEKVEQLFEDKKEIQKKESKNKISNLDNLIQNSNTLS